MNFSYLLLKYMKHIKDENISPYYSLDYVISFICNLSCKIPHFSARLRYSEASFVKSVPFCTCVTSHHNILQMPLHRTNKEELKGVQNCSGIFVCRLNNLAVLQFQLKKKKLFEPTMKSAYSLIKADGTT